MVWLLTHFSALTTLAIFSCGLAFGQERATAPLAKTSKLIVYVLDSSGQRPKGDLTVEIDQGRGRSQETRLEMEGKAVFRNVLSGHEVQILIEGTHVIKKECSTIVGQGGNSLLIAVEYGARLVMDLKPSSGVSTLTLFRVEDGELSTWEKAHGFHRRLSGVAKEKAFAAVPGGYYRIQVENQSGDVILQSVKFHVPDGFDDEFPIEVGDSFLSEESSFLLMGNPPNLPHDQVRLTWHRLSGYLGSPTKQLHWRLDGNRLVVTGLPLVGTLAEIEIEGRGKAMVDFYRLRLSGNEIEIPQTKLTRFHVVDSCGDAIAALIVLQYEDDAYSGTVFNSPIEGAEAHIGDNLNFFSVTVLESNVLFHFKVPKDQCNFSGQSITIPIPLKSGIKPSQPKRVKVNTSSDLAEVLIRSIDSDARILLEMIIPTNEPATIQIPISTSTLSFTSPTDGRELAHIPKTILVNSILSMDIFLQLWL
jgi:hypothetical protein